MKKLYDQLVIKDKEILVTKSQTLNLCKKWLTLFVALLCGAISAVLIIETSSSFRYLAIPLSILFVIYYAIVYAKIGRKENNNIIKIDNLGIVYYTRQHIELSWHQIAQTEDKSFYYDFPGNGPENKGWQHKILITYMDNEKSLKTLSIEHNLLHRNHEILLKYLSEYFTKNNNMM